MGDISEMILDGTCCQSCGMFLGDGEGFPQSCTTCQHSEPPLREKLSCPVCKKKVKGLNDHIRDVHPEHAARDKATRESEALRDMLDSARTDLEVMREALGVPVEPHQSLLERMVKAAQAKRDVRSVESLPWITDGSIPDAEELVLVEIEGDCVWPGSFDGQHWIDADGLPIENEKVIAWAHMPAGTKGGAV